MNFVTVIPARAGSKGIPKKNIRTLGGKPLVHWSVAYSLACPIVSRTVVSTDSEEIAGIAREAGAEVPFLRPEALAADWVQDYPVLRHALDVLEAEGGEIDVIVLLRPTSPFRPPGLIERGAAALERDLQATSVRSMAPSREHPYRQWIHDGDYVRGFTTGVPEAYNLPRQKLPSVLFQTGDLEMVRRSTLISGSVSGDRVLPLVLRHEEMVDIDSESDWEGAEAWLQRQKNQN